MARDGTVNICFHGVGAPARELETGEDSYWLETPQFLLFLDEIASWPSVHISFDDGNESDARIALPALVERGLKAKFFLIASRLDAPGSLTVPQVRELLANGMTIGTHGMFHRPWRDLSSEARESELVEARRQLEDITGAPVTEAACPLGRYDRRLLADLSRLGYQRVYTSDRRRTRADDWLQPRFSLRRSDTPESLRAEAATQRGLFIKAGQSAKALAKRLR
jgi:peptidoglycan/xylan/chitin deacetylase (PgdA/CDA1 family)